MATTRALLKANGSQLQRRRALHLDVCKGTFTIGPCTSFVFRIGDLLTGEDGRGMPQAAREEGPSLESGCLGAGVQRGKLDSLD